LPWAQRWGAFW